MPDSACQALDRLALCSPTELLGPFKILCICAMGSFCLSFLLHQAFSCLFCKPRQMPSLSWGHSLFLKHSSESPCFIFHPTLNTPLIELLFCDSTVPYSELNYQNFHIFSLWGCCPIKAWGLISWVLISTEQWCTVYLWCMCLSPIVV